MKNVVLFGDSMFGRFGREFIVKLEEAITDITVHNCAAGGFTTRDGIKRADFIGNLKAEYVCLSFGTNDSNPFKGQPVPLKEFTENLNSIIHSFAGSKIILFPCPPVYDPNDLVETKNFNDTLTPYNAAIKDLSLKTNSAYIDSENVYGKLLERGEDYHIEDGLHLNAFGYEILIQELSKLLT